MNKNVCAWAAMAILTLGYFRFYTVCGYRWVLFVTPGEAVATAIGVQV
jgi:hypothetical protein